MIRIIEVGMDQTCRIEVGIDHNLAETFLPINNCRQPLNGCYLGARLFKNSFYHLITFFVYISHDFQVLLLTYLNHCFN